MGTGKDGKRRKAAGRAREINRRPGSAREESEAAGRGAWKVLKDGLDQGRGGVGGIVGDMGGLPAAPFEPCLP